MFGKLGKRKVKKFDNREYVEITGKLIGASDGLLKEIERNHRTYVEYQVAPQDKVLSGMY